MDVLIQVNIDNLKISRKQQIPQHNAYNYGNKMN